MTDNNDIITAFANYHKLIIISNTNDIKTKELKYNQRTYKLKV